MENREYTLEEVKSEASEFLKEKKSINETTYINYRTSINYFIYYLEHISKYNSINLINKDKIVKGFQANLFEGFTYEVEDTKRTVKVKANGVNTHVGRIKAFLNSYLGFRVDVKKLSVNKPKYKSLKLEEIKLLINECPNKWKKEEIAVRNSTLIQFLFNTAFRINEALGIRTEDFYNKDGSYYVKIHEKGKASGVLTEVPISENTANLLNKYIKLKAVPSDFLFSTTRASTDGKAKALSRRYFNNEIIKLATYVDLKHGTNILATVENNSSHVFRHSKATYLLNTVKEDVVTVKSILRHDSIESTLVYLNPEEEAVNKIRVDNDIII